MNKPQTHEGRDWMADLRNVVAEAQALLDAAGVDGAAAAAQVHDKVADELDRARETLRELEEDASRYVRENPWQSLGLAAAVGLLVGLLVARRR